MTRLQAPETPDAPVAARRDHVSVHHGDTLTDPYAWLRDPGYPDVTDPDILGHLSAENEYFESVMRPYSSLTDALFAEIKGRVKEDEESVPWADGLYDFKWAFRTGAQYRTWYYRPRQASPFADAAWSVLYDEAAAAQNEEFFRLKQVAVSPDGRLCAVSRDTTGSERFGVAVFDILTGDIRLTLPAITSGEIVWDRASTGFFYVEVSKEWRPFRVWYKSLKAADPVQVFEETSGRFFTHITASAPRRHLIISAGDHVTSEVHLVGLDTPAMAPVCVAPRRSGHDYSVEEGEDADGRPKWFIRSNRDHMNFGLYVADDLSQGENGWIPVRPGTSARYLRGFLVQRGRVVVEESTYGRQDISVLSPGGEERLSVAWPEESRAAGLAHNPEFDAGFVRLSYSSLVTPQSVFDLNPETGDLTLRKEQQIPSGYDKSAYVSERLMVPVRDGAEVPVSLVYRKDWSRGSDAPLYLYGYGAYGLGMDPAFSTSRLSLLDRGFAFAIAHIRGGDELGYGWYVDGKLGSRTNTFNDFVDVARHLVAASYVKAGRITISGGSAGGELIGAAVNQAGELFAGAVLHVPFVDVLNTMLDETLPLTPMEWPEWGNPLENAEDYDLIKSYCPYTNIEAKPYPPMLVTGGLNDPRVTYWEPAKWTAKLRATKTDNALLLQKINMSAGHAGQSGRFDRLREVAEEYTFCLMCTGLADADLAAG